MLDCRHEIETPVAHDLFNRRRPAIRGIGLIVGTTCPHVNAWIRWAYDARALPATPWTSRPGGLHETPTGATAEVAARLGAS